VSHAVLMAVVIVKPIIIPHSIEYCIIPLISTCFGPAPVRSAN